MISKTPGSCRVGAQPGGPRRKDSANARHCTSCLGQAKKVTGKMQAPNQIFSWSTAQATFGISQQELPASATLKHATTLNPSIYIYLYLLSISFYVYLSVYRSIDLSIYRPIDLSTYRSIDLSIYLSIFLSIDLSKIYLSFCLSIYLSFFLSMYLSIYLITTNTRMVDFVLEAVFFQETLHPALEGKPKQFHTGHPCSPRCDSLTVPW